MTMLVVPALAVVQALFATAPAGAQEPAVQAVLADHAAEACAPGPQRATPAGERRCDAAGRLAEIAPVTDGVQRIEILIRWVELAAAPCLPPTPPAPAARRAGAAPAPTEPPPPPPTPEAVIAACDAALTWLTRFEAAGANDRARAAMAPALFLALGQSHRIRGQALATLEGGPSPRACAAFAAGRQAVARIDMAQGYARDYAESFRTQIAEVEAAGAACP